MGSLEPTSTPALALSPGGLGCEVPLLLSSLPPLWASLSQRAHTGPASEIVLVVLLLGGLLLGFSVLVPFLHISVLAEGVRLERCQP